MRAAFVLALFALAGCQTAHDLPSPTSLHGRFEAAEINDRPLEPDIRLEADADTLVLRSGCIEARWRYDLAAVRQFADKLPATSCKRALTVDEQRVIQTIDDTDFILFMDNGGMVFSGGANMLELTPIAEPPQVVIGPIITVEELEGHYRVAGLGDIDMAELDRGISVSINGDRIDVLLNCVNTHWIYRFEGARFVTTAVEDSEPCRRAQNPDEAAIQDGFDRAERVTRTPSNGILIEGSGPAITLFSQ